MIILAAAIILSLNSSGIISKANDATSESNMANKKEAASVALAEYELAKSLGETNLTATEYVQKALEDQGIDASDVTVDEKGSIVIGSGITFSKISAGELAIGSEVTASNGEEFYVIGFSEDNTSVNLLAKYTLKKENDEIILEQDTEKNSNALVFCSEEAWPGTSIGENLLTDLNNIQSIRNDTTSAVYKAMAYGNSLGVSGRLMTGGEASNLVETNNTIILYAQYGSEVVFGYWLSDGMQSVDGLVSRISGGSSDTGYSGFSDTSYRTMYGVRPVIEVSKSLIK